MSGALVITSDTEWAESVRALSMSAVVVVEGVTDRRRDKAVVNGLMDGRTVIVVEENQTPAVRKHLTALADWHEAPVQYKS